jgi:DNA-binding protein|tara:strand:+ start:619 stop:918 length:300 start_codon:yes stop_codon:yes gene_type:complete
MELQEIKRSDKEMNEENYIIRDQSVMMSAIDILPKLSSNKKIVLTAKGDLIPNAVAVANIVTENMLKGNSSIQEIKLDSVISEEDGQMTSNIKIILIKI